MGCHGRSDPPLPGSSARTADSSGRALRPHDCPERIRIASEGSSRRGGLMTSIGCRRSRRGQPCQPFQARKATEQGRSGPSAGHRAARPPLSPSLRFEVARVVAHSPEPERAGKGTAAPGLSVPLSRRWNRRSRGWRRCATLGSRAETTRGSYVLDSALTADVPLGPFQDHSIPVFSSKSKSSKLHARLTCTRLRTDGAVTSEVPLNADTLGRMCFSCAHYGDWGRPARRAAPGTGEVGSRW